MKRFSSSMGYTEPEVLIKLGCQLDRASIIVHGGAKCPSGTRMTGGPNPGFICRRKGTQRVMPWSGLAAQILASSAGEKAHSASCHGVA
jgi:hypothetical protein